MLEDILTQARVIQISTTPDAESSSARRGEIDRHAEPARSVQAGLFQGLTC